jgi:hypothetical protein
MGGVYRNCADATMTDAEADPWRALHQALLHATPPTEAHGVPLPPPTGLPREGVIPVARLSFPGRTRRQRPGSTNTNQTTNEATPALRLQSGVKDTRPAGSQQGAAMA